MGPKIETKPRRGAIPRAGRTADTVPRGKSEAPLYLQLAQSLKEEILSGAYPVGSQLPSEDELSSRFSVSRYTVREALRRLREDNLVSSRQGAGTTVVPTRSSAGYVHDVNSINDLVALANAMHFEVDSIGMTAIDEKLAERTGLRAGEEWLAVRGYGYAERSEAPICWAEYYINREFAGVGRLLHRHSGPVFPLIEDLFGQRIVEVHQEIAATMIPQALAGTLQVEPGSPALEVQRTFKLANGEIAQVTMSTYPASRYRHAMTMRRVKG